MPHPRDVFDHPDVYWNFLTAQADTDFEGQFFDRKEAGRPNSTGFLERNALQDLIKEITECVSAFANSNKQGGLLVLGISSKGEIKGIRHLSDAQRNNIANINAMLTNQAATVRFFDCHNESNTPDILCLIYVPHTEYGICETLHSIPKAWLRQGPQNIPMTLLMREQLRRDKKIVDFEQVYCCPYDPTDVDQAVLKEFRNVYPSYYEYNTEEFLYHISALIKDGQEYAFTNAGFLFFASNPQRKLTTAYIRLLRFEAGVENIDKRGLPTFERSFTGSLTKQIRDMRTFFQESGFFKTYQRRNADGGFTQEPEFPYISIDEAIVNAIAHRDYAMSLSVECESYKDTFLVRNPGRLLQRDGDVPNHFSLDHILLVSTPRNPQLIEWLRAMQDTRGSAFVKALSEGTKRMRDEMLKLHLPAPAYEVSQSQTTVILTSNATERETLMRGAPLMHATEFANLFPLSFLTESGQPPSNAYVGQQRQNFMGTLKDALTANRWFIDSFSFSRLIVHRQELANALPENVRRTVRFFPAYSFQLRSYWGHYFLCIDYTLEVKNSKVAKDLLTYLKPDELIQRTALAQWRGGWHHGKIVSLDQEWTHIRFFDFEQEEQVVSAKVYPRLPTAMIERVLNQQGIRFDLYQAIKEHSLALETNASRIRLDKTQAIANNLAQSVFPLNFGDLHAFLQPNPTALSRQQIEKPDFYVSNLPEPMVVFNQRQETADIRSGITTFGAYENAAKRIELIPICMPKLRENMVALIERLKIGKHKYRGSERTFSTRFNYTNVITVASPQSIVDECKRLLSEHEEWSGDRSLSRMFLIHTPESGYASDDENSPYYLTKRFLLEQGVPCQMIDTPTLLNPDYKDLNLALNIIAKCGITPWVLPDAIPDADFFVGLSYTGNLQRGVDRLMGYANVFNQYGRWEFYSGNTTVFSYDERLKHYQSLIRQTLERLDLPETPSIYFHYSARFSWDDRKAILAAARSVRPKGTYSFIWINTQHNVRLYDSRAETNGSLSRGSYVITSPNQIYLSTTGNNPYRKALGTPKMLEINVTIERPEGMPNPEPDLREVAIQILSLTKLNWASTDSLCAEPITIKYAGDIAYLTGAFLRQNQSFQLHRVLEKTPWFI